MSGVSTTDMFVFFEMSSLLEREIFIFIPTHLAALLVFPFKGGAVTTNGV